MQLAFSLRAKAAGYMLLLEEDRKLHATMPANAMQSMYGTRL